MSAVFSSVSKYQLFFQSLSRASERVLLLDYDGTLAPFVPERDKAYPYPEVPSLLSALSASGTQVIIASGRRALDIPKLLDLTSVSQVWGCHGLERLWRDGTYIGPQVPEETQAALNVVDGYLISQGLNDCIELKPGCIAVHWRGLPDEDRREIEAIAQRSFALFNEVAGLSVLPFDGGLELRMQKASKRFVIDQVLAESTPNAAISYMGDDLTDEDAFHALRGSGLSVLVRPEYRDTAADLWLQSPKELFSFLERWLEASGGAQ